MIYFLIETFIQQCPPLIKRRICLPHGFSGSLWSVQASFLLQLPWLWSKSPLPTHLIKTERDLVAAILRITYFRRKSWQWVSRQRRTKMRAKLFFEIYQMAINMQWIKNPRFPKTEKMKIWLVAFNVDVAN